MSENQINPEDITSKIETSKKESEESDFQWLEELQEESAEAENLEGKENREILEMRTRWSNWVLIFIGVILIFDIILVTFYGLGIWNFTNSSVVIAVITDNFLKIVGLGFLITKEIFKKIYH